MHEILDVLLAVVGSGAAVAALSIGIVLRRVRRANRVVPDRRSPAPLTWRWSPGRAATLHRRLRRSCQVVAAVTGPLPQHPGRRRGWRRRPAATSVLASAGADLLARAVAADTRLAEVARGGPGSRRIHLPEVAAEVTAIESGAARLADLDRRLRARAAGGQPGPEQAEDLLDAFEAALDELGPAPPPDPPLRSRRRGAAQPRAAAWDTETS